MVTASCKEDGCDNKNAPTMECSSISLQKERQIIVVLYSIINIALRRKRAFLICGFHSYTFGILLDNQR